MAGLWHMPVGEALELVRREGYERYVPLPEDVSGLDGVLVGVSVKADKKHPTTKPASQCPCREMQLRGIFS